MSWVNKYWPLLAIVVVCVFLLMLAVFVPKTPDEISKEAALNAKCYWNPAGVCLCVYKSYSVGFMAYAPDRACPQIEEDEMGALP